MRGPTRHKEAAEHRDAAKEQAPVAHHVEPRQGHVRGSDLEREHEIPEPADSERHQAENEDIEQLFRHALSNPAIPLAQRVRMACAIGAVLVTLMGASDAFGDVPAGEIAELVREAVRDLVPAPAS